MDNSDKKITITVTVKAPIEKVWELWSGPGHIQEWATASADWHTPHAENDLKEGGKFKNTMAAKDGSFSFDFEGTYDKVDPLKLIEYMLADGRKVMITFEDAGNSTTITETFDPEQTNPVEMQRTGWQAILYNFKKYVEKNS